MKISKALLASGFLSCVFTTDAFANSVIESLKEGEVYGAMRIRHENVRQDNAAKNANAF